MYTQQQHRSGAGYTSYTDNITRRQRSRALIAAIIGTTIEWWDIVVYGLLANLVIAPLFFPARDPLASALGANLGLVVSAASRPLGAMFFGHYGDRLGRKVSLLATLLLAGLASFLIGTVPTYGQFGVLAPIALLVLRVFVGAGLGGEWPGSVLLMAEWGNHGRRGWWAAMPQASFGLATILALLAIQGGTALFGAGSTWVWRAPFLVSIVLIAVGLYVRLGIMETPTFTNLLDSRRTVRAPLLVLLRGNWREVILTAILKVGEQASTVMFGTFLLLYIVTGLHMSRNIAVIVLLTSSVVGVLGPPAFGYVSDRMGRRMVFGLGAAFLGAWMAFVFFPLMATRDLYLILMAAFGGQLFAAMMAGPEAAFIAETFTGRVRYSGTALGAGLGGFLAVLTAPLSIYLFATYHSAMPIGFYLGGWALVSLIAAQILHERQHQDLAIEYDDELSIVAQASAAAQPTTAKRG